MYSKIHNHLVILSFFLTLSYLTYDIIVDSLYGHKDFLFYIEMVSVGLIIFLIINQMSLIRKTSQELNDTKTILQAVQGKMSEYIEEKFIEWKFTKSENEVAWLIVKGFSPKEISLTRNVNEKTIHNQLSSIYRKSNTKNKHELLSSFLEDFMNIA
jgi:DNA-binding CsgD family transcriptional regulator